MMAESWAVFNRDSKTILRQFSDYGATKDFLRDMVDQGSDELLKTYTIIHIVNNTKTMQEIANDLELGMSLGLTLNEQGVPV